MIQHVDIIFNNSNLIIIIFNYIIIDFNIKTANDTNTKNVIIEDVNFNISAI